MPQKRNIERKAYEAEREVYDRFFRAADEFICLRIISNGPIHGYALIKYISETFDTRVHQPKYYQILDRLEGAGQIVGHMEESNIKGKPKKKVFTLTTLGEQKLAEYESAFSRFLANMSKTSPSS